MKDVIKKIYRRAHQMVAGVAGGAFEMVAGAFGRTRPLGAGTGSKSRSCRDRVRERRGAGPNRRSCEAEKSASDASETQQAKNWIENHIRQSKEWLERHIQRSRERFEDIVK